MSKRQYLFNFRKFNNTINSYNIKSIENKNVIELSVHSVYLAYRFKYTNMNSYDEYDTIFYFKACIDILHCNTT